MRKTFIFGLLGLTAVACWFGFRGTGATEAATAADPMLVHMVYFSLKDNSAAGKQKLVSACKKYLADHDGTVFFAAGTLAQDLKRPVNDQDFDVGLHLVFKNRAAHDKYQDAPTHLRFIEENKETWKKVRVFDSVAER